MKRKMTTCKICEKEDICFAWTDTHGVAQCTSCGVPYRILFYEEKDGKDVRVEKDPKCLCNEKWVDLLKAYHKEDGHKIPGGHSFPGGQEICRKEDFEAFNDFCDKHKKRFGL